MQAIVFGNGSSGRAAAETLRRSGRDVTILDGADRFPADVPADTLCVTSPGIPLDHPWQVAARAAGLRVVSELELGVRRYRELGGRLLAVTGSKGKSSVVKLVAEALGGVACGNYGRPICDVANACEMDGTRPWAVVEVSSFQLETTDLPAEAFVAAAVLNLQEDHLDRHGGVAAYHALKRRLLGMATTRIEPPVSDEAASAPEDALFGGGYFDNPVLKGNGRRAVALVRAACAAEGVPAAVADARAAAAFRAFEPLPHRMQTVAVTGGVTWIDDSKATSLAALAAGVVMARARFGEPSPGGRKGLFLIAGGIAKGDSPDFVIICLQKHVEKVYLIGRCAEKFFSAWSTSVPCERCGTLTEAVEAARRDAVPGDIVLLSPGTASFDQFTSYGARGDAFAKAVKRRT